MRQVLIDTDPYPRRIVAEIDDPILAKQIHAMADFVAGCNRYQLEESDTTKYDVRKYIKTWREDITGQDIADTMPPKPDEAG